MIERRERNAMPPRTAAEVAKALDHAVLKPEYSRADLEKHAAMCVARGVGCLCVRSADVAVATRLVSGSPVVVASVIGFPHGAQRPEVKALESRHAIADGARELDMVVNVGALKSGDEAAVRADIAAVVAEAKPRGVVVKVILETCYLTPAEIATACRLAESAGADFVKTSTGFGVQAGGATGATPEAVRAMLDAVGGRLQVKASGGIRTWDDAVGYLDMGCTRIGVGDAAAILDGGPARGDASY
jgi:deoxyribose-phosphate aldolase